MHWTVIVVLTYLALSIVVSLFDRTSCRCPSGRGYGTRIRNRKCPQHGG